MLFGTGKGVTSFSTRERATAARELAKVPLASKGGTTLGIPPLPQIVPTPKNTHKKKQIPVLWSVRGVDRKAPARGAPKVP